MTPKLKVTSYLLKKNYHLYAGKLEFLALKSVVTERFDDYLVYGPLTTANINATGLSWVAELANYKFKIHYHRRIKNKKLDWSSGNL